MRSLGDQSYTIGSILARRVRLSPDRIAVIDGKHIVTFSQLDRNANSAANLLSDHGMKKGDRVGILAPNCAEFCELFYGCARAGMVCCGLNYRLSSSELAAVIADSGLKLLFAHSQFFDLAHQSSPRGSDVEIILLDDQGYGRLRNSASDSPPQAMIEASDLIGLVYTSGTTGLPKGAMISHENMFWASLTIGQSVDFRLGDIHLLPVPMFHVGGLSFTVHTVHAGATMVMPEKWGAEEILEKIDSHEVNHFFSVPTMLRDLLDSSAFSPERLSSVRWILSGGAPVPASLVHEFSDLDIPVMQSYGATETCGPGIFVDQDHAVEKAGSIGKAFFHTDCRVINDEGKDAGPQEPGEILLRAGHVFSGYWNKPDATANALDAEGWFHTGDIGFYDSQGFITLMDRKKNKIITGGENVYPRELESVLESHAGIADVAVVGRKDTRWGEIVCAVVVPKDNGNIELKEVRKFCEGKIARYKMPKSLIVIDALPRNATGKLLRPKLLEFLENLDE